MQISARLGSVFSKNKLLLAIIVATILGTTLMLTRDSLSSKTLAAPGVSSLEQMIIGQTNQSRHDVGEKDLIWNPELQEAAEQKALDMFANSYFDHIGPEGQTPWQFIAAEDYYYQSAGENLAIDFSDLGRVVGAWLDSPSHRKNVLDPNFSEIGLAVVEGTLDGAQTTVVVQMLAEPLATSKSLPAQLTQFLEKSLPN